MSRPTAPVRSALKQAQLQELQQLLLRHIPLQEHKYALGAGRTTPCRVGAANCWPLSETATGKSPARSGAVRAGVTASSARRSAVRLAASSRSPPASPAPASRTTGASCAACARAAGFRFKNPSKPF